MRITDLFSANSLNSQLFKMAQYLDAESGLDVIDISSATEDKGNRPPQDIQGEAGMSDADFDTDIYPQPNRTVNCASSARTTTMTLLLRT